MNKHKLIIWFGLTILFMMGCGLFGVGINGNDDIKNDPTPTPCVDPGVVPPFEIYISRCEDAYIKDFSSDGRYMTVLIDQFENQYYLINLETDEKTPLPLGDILHLYLPYLFISDDFITNQEHLVYIPEMREVEVEIVNIEEDENWATKLKEMEKIYIHNRDPFGIAFEKDFQLNDTGIILFTTGGFMQAEYLGEKFDEQGISFVWYISQYEQCKLMEECFSPSGNLKYDNQNIEDLDGNIVFRIDQFSDVR